MTSHSKHSRLMPPSKMERRIACPGSAHIDNKDVPSKYTKEGTEAHKIAEILFTTNGPVECSEETAKYIGIYIDYCDSLKGTRSIETKVTINSISNELYGTADCIINDWPETLHIIDLKYGAGIIYEPENNAQLVSYALGALESFGSDFNEIWITIVQPRIEHKNGPIRTWKTTPVELYKIWHPKIKKAYETALAKPYLFKLGPHCKWCSGVSDCPKAEKQSKSLAKKQEKNESITADNKKLAKLLNSEQMVLEYFNKVKMEAFNRLREGQKIPGFKLVRNFGNTTWRSKVEAEKVLHHHADAWESKLMAISKIKKQYPDIVDRLTHRPDKGLALVPESDKRQPYRGAADDFAEE